MKRYLLLLILFCSAPSALSQESERPVGDDKILHFSVSAIGTSGGIKLLQAIDSNHEITWGNRVLASAFMAAVGVAKELHDAQQPYNKYDNEDNQANLVGIITGNILQWEF